MSRHVWEHSMSSNEASVRALIAVSALAFAAGCSGSVEDSAHQQARVTASPPPPVLGYFEAQTDFGIERHHILIRTDELGQESYVAIEGCPDERAVRSLFGSWSAPLEYRYAPEGEQLADRISCPEDLSSSLRLYVGHGISGTSYVEFRARAWPSGLPLPAGADAPPSFYAIPNACGGLMRHFDVIPRARQRPLADTEGLPESGSRIVQLSCAYENAPAPDNGWTLERMRSTVRTAADAVEGTNVFRLARGNTSLYLHAVDGVELSTLDSSQQQARFYALWTRFGLQGDREQAFHLWDEPYMYVWALEPSQAPSTVAFDVCLDRCDDATFRPRHFGVEATDRGDYLARCLSGGGLEACSSTFQAAPGALLYEAYASTKIGGRSFLLPSCAPDVDWRRLLGLRSPASVEGWAADRAREYAQVSSNENPVGTESLACLRESQACVVRLPEQYDLSRLDVTAQANSCLASGASVIRFVLGQQTRLTGKTLRVEGNKLPKDSFGRPRFQQVELLGGNVGSTLTISDALCATANGSCTSSVPAIAVDGDISLRVHNLQIVEGSVAAGRQALARDVVSASAGARLRVTGSALGAAANGASFYRGVVVDGGTAQVLDSAIRAYRYAASVRNGTLAAATMTGTPAAIGALPVKAAAYYDLDGRRLANAGDFAALDLGMGSSAFLARVDTYGPTGIVWNNPLYTGPVSATRSPDLWAIDLSYQSWAVATFPTSTLASILGTGTLYFARPKVSAKSVVRCDGGPSAIEFYLPAWYGDTLSPPPATVRQCVIDSNAVGLK